MITELFKIVLIGTYVMSFGLVIYFYIELMKTFMEVDKVVDDG